MPWNRKMRRSVQQHRRHEELLHLVEATAGTVGLIARQLGFGFHSASTSQRNGDVEHTVLYEAAPAGLADRYARLAGPDDPCVDLWVYWEPESGRLEVDPPGSHGLRALETLERQRLVEITNQPVVEVDELRVALDGWGEGLRAWLEEGQTP
jgi:hypothetical protein